jgi:hypothetical protein
MLVYRSPTGLKRGRERKRHILVVLDGLDVEAECGIDDARVLSIDLEHDGRLPRVVQPPETNPQNIASATENQEYKENPETHGGSTRSKQNQEH